MGRDNVENNGPFGGREQTMTPRCARFGFCCEWRGSIPRSLDQACWSSALRSQPMELERRVSTVAVPPHLSRRLG